jgi:hypothetical protein
MSLCVRVFADRRSQYFGGSYGSILGQYLVNM